jgi:glycolate oxidase iron-sulfur subunit
VKTTLDEYTHELEICSRCGLCSADCPTYVVTQEESRLARGRAALMEALLVGKLDQSDAFHAVIDTCIGCHSCVVACPSAVPVDAMSAAARSRVHARSGLPLTKRMAYARLSRPGGLLAATRWGRALSRPLAWLGRQTIHLPHLSPGPVRGRTLPLPAPRFFEEACPETIPAWCGRLGSPTAREPLGRVAFFYGCMINLVYPEMGIATVDVLSRTGFEVVVPRRQPCCGIPLLTAGEYERARAVARTTVEMLLATGADHIVTSCATCSATLREEYRELLHGEDEADVFCDRVLDITQFLFARGETLSSHLSDASDGSDTSDGSGTGAITYHDPCHLNRRLGVTKEPRELLRATGVDLVEMEEPEMCCGFGGTFSFDHYDLARKISARKVENAAATGARIIATGCPGCIMHIRDAVARAGLALRVLHPIEILSSSLR